MIYIQFNEKHDDRIVAGETKEAILAKVLKDRVEDTWGSDESIWYVEDTEKARKALETSPDMACRFMLSRQGHEYEGFREVTIEVV